MGRWTELQKEWQGYKRKLAYGKQEVSLKEAPWEKEDESKNRDDQFTDQEERNGTGRYTVGQS